MSWREFLFGCCLVLFRKSLDCFVDLPQAAHAGGVADFAGAHAGFGQLGDLLRDYRPSARS